MNWNEIFEPPTLVFLVGALIAIVAIISHHARLAAQHEASTELARSMVERGIPANEIERVLAALASGADPQARVVREMKRA